MKKTKIAVIVSVYNEQEVIEKFWTELKSVLNKLSAYSFQVYFVNDGSKDKSQIIIDKIINDKTISEIQINSIEFTRNFGHEAAMLAGIDSSNSDIVIVMDSDLQHPPKKIPEMIEKYNNGYQIILMNRIKRHDNGLIKNILSATFYKFMDLLSTHKFEKNASDFFLISKEVANIIKTNFRERNRFLRGFIQIIGFSLTTVDFEASERIAGKSNYSIKSLFKLAFTAIFAFSNKPLKISLYSSFIFLLFSIGIIIYSLIVFFFVEKPPSGYTSLIIFQGIGFSVLSFLISILSIYFGKSLDEIRDRPIYLVKKSIIN